MTLKETVKSLLQCKGLRELFPRNITWNNECNFPIYLRNIYDHWQHKWFFNHKRKYPQSEFTFIDIIWIIRSERNSLRSNALPPQRLKDFKDCMHVSRIINIIKIHILFVFV